MHSALPHAGNRLSSRSRLKATHVDGNIGFRTGAVPGQLVVPQKPSLEVFKGGVSGALAGVIQVVTMMWLRTLVNYQARHGGSTIDSFKVLYNDGGISRFYRGFPFAVLQGPLSRFGSVAGNEISQFLQKSLVSSAPSTFLTLVFTAVGAIIAGVWRIMIMPIDTCKVRWCDRVAMYDVVSRCFVDRLCSKWLV